MRTELPVEHRLLTTARWRLAAWTLLAFLVLEVLIMGAAYAAVYQDLYRLDRQVVEEEWSGKRPEVLRLEAGRAVEAGVDRRAELVATWVWDAQGRLLKRDNHLLGTGRSLRTLLPLQGQIRAAREAGRAVWTTCVWQGTPLLIGTDPVYDHSRLAGSLQSAYSLTRTRQALQAAVRADVAILSGSLVVAVPLAFLVAGRAVGPIRSAMEAQRRFVQDASHELRTPLAVLRATLELAREDPDPAAVRAGIGEALVEVDYLGTFVGDLATLARAESGATPLQQGPVDLAALAVEVLAAMETLPACRDLRLEAGGCGPPVEVCGDARRLRQLVYILVDNAVKYNRPGGWVALRVAAERNQVLLEVADGGRGIPAAELPLVRRRFYRGRGRGEVSGSGLGLAIADWIVHAHRGRWRIRSREGQGTTVEVWLPRRAGRRPPGCG
ncbi:putative Histidine kinase domain-containing protein [Candidatus Hydrogenisulfobacillus filiaventi]|uniref:histidine kinase n=1 Tax=Candidatus Hydrogenisulfobacillus filiaventi TaxID=2707344 RepID=A0A6F8ZID0_9FIRM|nr:putative Histidine kinase domain-containing protein [Candidatus Hydrogenisulfobacillus filiaventi]